jgi:hypothetical protein
MWVIFRPDDKNDPQAEKTPRERALFAKNELRRVAVPHILAASKCT